jgi:Zn-dependent peptidase ImmA (M78 family)
VHSRIIRAVTHARIDPSTTGARYDPWQDLRARWPEIEIRTAPLRGDLLGILQYPVITLRAGTSAAQRRCTLAHELVHLERGVPDCGLWAAREEFHVHAAAARRLIATTALARAVHELCGTADPAALAALLDVDRETLSLRLRLLTGKEQSAIRTASVRDLWSVA